MKPMTVLLDCNYLIHRAVYAMGGLEYDGIPTNGIYGLLRDVVTLRRDHVIKHMVFCFDHPPYKRKDLLQSYKDNRKILNQHPDKKLLKDQIREQTLLIRDKYLPALGFSNVLHTSGYEADDVIASICKKHNTCDGSVMIVGTDQDLYQCLKEHPWIFMYDPRKAQIYDHSNFVQEWNMTPDRWPEIKAMAGCDGDNIKGVRFVGELTAAKYLRGEIPERLIAFKRCSSPEAAEIVETNLRLVSLPFDDKLSFGLKEDKLTVASWRGLCNKLGLKSLLDYPSLLVQGMKA